MPRAQHHPWHDQSSPPLQRRKIHAMIVDTIGVGNEMLLAAPLQNTKNVKESFPVL